MLLAPQKLKFAETDMPTLKELADEMGEETRWIAKQLDAAEE
jgi:hypothetical protein